MKNTHFIRFVMTVVASTCLLLANAQASKMTLDDVMMFYHPGKAEFSTHFHALRDGKWVSLAHDKTCDRIHLEDDGTVFCFENMASTEVGKIGPQVWQTEAVWAFRIFWRPNVELSWMPDGEGHLVPTVRLKSK